MTLDDIEYEMAQIQQSESGWRVEPNQSSASCSFVTNNNHRNEIIMPSGSQFPYHANNYMSVDNNSNIGSEEGDRNQTASPSGKSVASRQDNESTDKDSDDSTDNDSEDSTDMDFDNGDISRSSGKSPVPCTHRMAEASSSSSSAVEGTQAPCEKSADFYVNFLNVRAPAPENNLTGHSQMVPYLDIAPVSGDTFQNVVCSYLSDEEIIKLYKALDKTDEKKSIPYVTFFLEKLM